MHILACRAFYLPPRLVAIRSSLDLAWLAVVLPLILASFASGGTSISFLRHDIYSPLLVG